MNHAYDKTLYWIALISMAGFAVVSIFCVYLALKAGVGHITCTSPVPYSEKLSSFLHGNRGLDGDKDGAPCDNEKPKDTK